MLPALTLSLREERQQSPRSSSCLRTSARSKEHARALVPQNTLGVPEAQQDKFCLPPQSCKPGEVPAEPPEEHCLANPLITALCTPRTSQSRREPGPWNSAASSVLPSQYRRGDSSGQTLPGQPSVSRLQQLVLLQKPPKPARSLCPGSLLAPALPPGSHTMSPLPPAPLSASSLAKGSRRSPQK